jgi:GxxExxY protein
MGRPDDVVSERVIGACIEVHRHLGPGLLEGIYEDCLCHELGLRGIDFVRQVVLPVSYKGLVLDACYRLDLVAEARLIVELKSVEALLPVHVAQLSTYLRASQFEVGLLVNFNVALLKEGIRRFTKRAHKSSTVVGLSPSDLQISKLL